MRFHSWGTISSEKDSSKQAKSIVGNQLELGEMVASIVEGLLGVIAKKFAVNNPPQFNVEDLLEEAWYGV